MRIIDDMVSDFRYKKYKDKFLRFNVSPAMARFFNADDGINIIKMVNGCKDFFVLKDTIIVDLLGPRKNDFLISSLLFGLYFDAFNLYSYMYIDPEVRREIAICDLNKEKTELFFRENDIELFSYFSEKYGIDRNEYNSFIKSLFQVTLDDNELYNSKIIKDVEKMLMGWTLCGRFTSCDQLIEAFNNINENNIKKAI